MPETTWEEINDAIHNKKNTLVKIAAIQRMAKGVASDIEQDMERLNTIILRQPDEEDK